MPIYTGPTKLKDIYNGPNKIKYVYQGSNLKFSPAQTEPNPVTITGCDVYKFQDDYYFSYGFEASGVQRWSAYSYTIDRWNLSLQNLEIYGDNFGGISVTVNGDTQASGVINNSTQATVNFSIGQQDLANGSMGMTITIYPPTTPFLASDVARLYFTLYYGVCFSEDTLITMEGGERKMIKDVKVGDKILTYSPKWTPKTGKHYVTTVYGVNRGIGYEYRKLTLSNGTELKIYGDKQRLYSVEYKKQMCIKYFKVGDHLLDILGDEVEILAIELVNGEAAYHYSLVTDSSLYTANNICVGHCNGIQYLYAKDQVPEEKLEKLKVDYDYFVEYTFPTFNEEFAAKFKKLGTLEERRQMIKAHQIDMKKLSPSEWKARKLNADLELNLNNKVTVGGDIRGDNLHTL